MMRGSRSLFLSLLVLLAGVVASAQETPEKYLELLRSDLRAEKVNILTEALELPDAQATAFWPIYREYDAELAAWGDRRIALIKQFAEKYGSLTDADAASIGNQWLTLQDDRNKLRRKYYKKVEKATSSLVAARFMQVENVIGNLIDLQIGAELPLIE